MGVFFDVPTYPVIDKAPGFWKTVGNFHIRDWGVAVASSAVCYPYGWVVGRSAKVTRQSALMASAIGGLGGFMYSYQNSSGRLMGFFPNDTEVEAGLAGSQRTAQGQE